MNLRRASPVGLRTRTLQLLRRPSYHGFSLTGGHDLSYSHRQPHALLDINESPTGATIF